MVTDHLTEDASQRRAAVADDGLEFQIVDETSSEQVEREQRLLASSGMEVPASGPEAQEEPQSGPTAEPQDQPGRDAMQAGAQQPRTYSQAEVSKMQAAWSRQIEEARRSAEQASNQLFQFNLDAAVEAMLRKQESEIAASVGPEEAKRLTRSPQNTALARQSLINQQLLAQSEAGRQQAVEQQEQQAKLIVARELAKQHGLSDDDFRLLTSAPTPAAMNSLARRLGGRDVAAVRDRVPPETAETRLENGYHAGPAPETAERRLERIRARPSWEWTETDLQYMKTGRMR